jgi:sortase A
MLANLTDVIAEADVSEEFRTFLWVLIQEGREGVQEKQEGAALSAVQSSAKQTRNAWTWIERGLLVSGLALLVAYGAARLEGFFSSRAALQRFSADTGLSTPASENATEETAPSGIGFSLWDAHRVRAHRQDLKSTTAPLAVLRISKIGLTAPLLDGTDALTLNRGLGRISGTARPGGLGNLGIAGHRDGFFRGLKDLGPGDTIDLTIASGTDRYVVDQIEIVKPNDVHVLQSRAVPSLTLVTCYPFYFVGSAPQRYVVHASRTGFEPTQSNPTEQGSLILANGNKEKTQ